MTKSLSTPGPWALMDKGDYSDFNGNSRVILSEDIGGENPFRIAVVHVSDDEAEANARLIASAPEMYEGLCALADYEWQEIEPNGADIPEHLQDYIHELEQFATQAQIAARATIAKAKGEVS